MTEPSSESRNWRDKVEAIKWDAEHTDHYLLARAMAYKLDFPEETPVSERGAWVKVGEGIPEYEKRAHPGDTVSHYVEICNADTTEREYARFHFPTGDWCWRDGTWKPTHWREVIPLPRPAERN